MRKACLETASETESHDIVPITQELLSTQIKEEELSFLDSSINGISILVTDTISLALLEKVLGMIPHIK